MYIIGMILKIIGILLLCVLGIVLVLLLSVLFVPIRYRLHWEKQLEKPHCVSVRLSWWLHLLVASVEYQKQACYVIRVFGIPIKKGSFQNDEEEKQEEEDGEDVSDDFSEMEKQERFEKKSMRAVEEKRSSEMIETENKEENGKSDQTKNGQMKKKCTSREVQTEIDATKKNRTTKKENTRKENEEIETDAQEFDIAVSKPPKKKMYIWKRWMEKVKNFVGLLKKIPKFFKSMFYKVRDLWQNVDNKREHMLKKVHVVFEFFRAEENQAGKRVLFERGKKIVKHILPKKWKGHIRFGLSDPANTGKALAAIAVVGGLIGMLPEVEPDFSKETLEGNVDCHGRLQIGYVLWQILRLWFCEDIQRLKHNFEKVRRAL